MESLDSTLGRNLELYLFDENGKGLFYYDLNNDNYDSEVDKQLISGLLMAINGFALEIGLGTDKDTLRVIKGDDEFRIVPSTMVYCALRINGSEGIGKRAYEKIDYLVKSVIKRIMMDYSGDLTKFNYEGGTEAFREFGEVIKQEVIRVKEEVNNDYLNEVMEQGNLIAEKEGLNKRQAEFNDTYKSIVLANEKTVKHESLINELTKISEHHDRVKSSLADYLFLDEVIKQVNAETRPLCDFFKVRQIG